MIEPNTAVNKIPPQGLFPPNSMVWKINRDAAVLLGGLRALIMQIAHPLVAQGVADHSRFQQDPIGRLNRTLKVVLALAFGNRETIIGALSFLDKIHRPVKGQLSEPTGSFSVEKPYSADDQDLRFWVFATLVESSLTMYERLVHPLTADEKAIYYEENLRMAELLQIAQTGIPENYEEFEAYFNGMICGDQVSINETGKKLADDIFHPQLAYVPRIFHWPVRYFTVGLLPPVLREKFGFRWDWFHQQVFEALFGVTKFVLKIIPVGFRTLPAAKKAKKRWKNIASG